MRTGTLFLLYQGTVAALTSSFMLPGKDSGYGWKLAFTKCCGHGIILIFSLCQRRAGRILIINIYTQIKKLMQKLKCR